MEVVHMVTVLHNGSGATYLQLSTHAVQEALQKVLRAGVHHFGLDGAALRCPAERFVRLMSVPKND